MSYNKKMFRQMVEESKQKKTQPKPKDRIVDPMGQWAHPGQVTRIPSNRITMQGVPYPVLGVGNNGQQQMMYPGQEYAFPGSQYVDEYPMMKAQNGGTSDPQERAKKAKDFLTNMYNSPLFAKRYAAMTGRDLKDIDAKEIEQYKNTLLNNLNTVYAAPFGEEPKKGEFYTGDDMSFPNLIGGVYYENPPEVGKPGHSVWLNKYFADQPTTTHEWSHASTRSNTNLPFSPKIPFNYDASLAGYAQEQFANENKKTYLTDPTEIKGRKDAVAQFLQEQGVWDPTTERFGKKQYDYLKNLEKEVEYKLDNELQVDDRLLELLSQWQEISLPYKEEDTHRMFNEIVKGSNNNNYLKFAKYGGDISIPNLEEGNWLNRYDDGGEAVLTKFYNNLFKNINKRAKSGNARFMDRALGSLETVVENPLNALKFLFTKKNVISNPESNPYGVDIFSDQKGLSTKSWYPKYHVNDDYGISYPPFQSATRPREGNTNLGDQQRQFVFMTSEDLMSPLERQQNQFSNINDFLLNKHQKYQGGGQLQKFAPGGATNDCPPAASGEPQMRLPNGQCGTYADLQRMMASSTWNNIQKSNQMVWQNNVPKAQPVAQTKTTQPKSNKVKVAYNINQQDVTRRGDIATQTGTGTEVLRQNVVGNQAVADKKYQTGVQALVSSGMSEEQADRQYRNYKQNPTAYSNTGKTIENYENRNYRIKNHPDYDPNKSFDEQAGLANDNSVRARLLRGSNMLTNSGNPLLDLATGIITSPARSLVNLTTNAEQSYFNPNNSFLQNATNLAFDVADVIPFPVAQGLSAAGRGTKNIVNKTGNYLTKNNVFSFPGSKFKSEIDWGKWNPETSNYPELINEYNAIEESTKKAGTWMKNADGSPFQGTPEQFIQQQSTHFKKAFPNPIKNFEGNIQYNYHVSPNKFDFFDESKFKTGTYGKGIYTTPIKITSDEGRNIYQLYINANNPQNKVLANELGKIEREYKDALRNFYNGQYIGSKEDAMLKIKDLQKKKNELWANSGQTSSMYGNIEPGYDFYSPSFIQESVIPFTNYPKSAIGNVGFFDMTNPNIYKAIVPAAIGTTALGAIEEKKKGGQTNWLDKYN